MNEYLIFSEMDLKNICCVCLKRLRVVDSMWIMSENEMILYRSIVRKNTNQTLQTCLLCKWMLGKFSKFAQQCQKADELLCQTLIDSTPLEPVPLSYNFITTHQTCSISENDDESCSNFDDIDEVPLVEFKKEVIEKWNGKRKRRKRKQNEEESPIKELKEEKYSKPKKELKSGFTSRMVQETDEYEVIKLTKDEVLQEMNEKSKEISYIQTPYKCDKCVKGFNFEDVLRKHNEKHCMENGSFQCDICLQYCPSAVSLRGHIKSHTTRYKCKVCGTIRLSRQHLLEHHAITHTGQPTSYSCETCSYTTNKRTVIQRHVRSHATSQQHACHECGKLFKSIDSLRIHATRHSKSGCYQCETCDKAFTYPCLLRKHLNTAHDGDTHYCVECDVKFKSFESLRLHFKRAKRHRDESSYTFKCRHCPETFVTGSALSAHLTSIHGEAKQHSCAVCSKWFSSKEALRSHHWKVHDSKGNRQVKCDVCQRSFNRKSVLKLHARTHTGERPHSCECGAAFSQRTTLRAHRNAKHKIENGIINAMTIPTVLHETT